MEGGRRDALSLAVGCLGLALAAGVARAQTVDFNRDVRPILSEHCFACHGPDQRTREADLRLDKAELATEDRGGYRVIAPGEAAESELIRRLTTDDAFERMPPEEFGKPLSEDQIATLRRWIDQGAAWQQHWSLTPLQRPEIPSLENDSAAHPVDAFIGRRLQEADLELSPPADRRTLVRRLAFDLTGLPPSPELVEEFRADTSADAYPRLVDRLLRSPHYGERMAMYWLDLVRYADTLGYHGDQVRSVSPYRDYVIAAFNDNLPFDQFTIENIAGDLLPEATLAQRVASTYNRLNRASAEGGVQPKEYLAKYAADRVRTTSSVWLGMTLGCAECHDHKFDPFTAKDFYSFAAFFADIKEQGIVSGANHVEQLPVPTPAQQRESERLEAAIGEAERALDAETPELAQAFARWQTQLRDASHRWHPLAITTAQSAEGATLEVLEDGSVRASGKTPDRDTYTLHGAIADLRQIGALRLEVLEDPSLPSGGPGRAGNGNFVVQGVELAIDGTPLAWASAAASHEQSDPGNYKAASLLDGGQSGWAILPHAGRTHQLVLTAKAPRELPSDATQPAALAITIRQTHGDRHTLGRFRLYAAAEVDAVEPEALQRLNLARLAARPEDERSAADQAQLRSAFRQQTPLLAAARERLAELKAAREKLQQSIPTTLVTTSVEPREMRLLPRGNWMDDSGPVVLPAVPAVLAIPGTASDADRRLTRLDLARWMVAPENPLVARTFVNRLWMLMFGHGLARNVDDLGSQGEAPTHPELLDWLAAEFIDSGWDVKHLVRLLVTSEAYRQRSDASPEQMRRDPRNRFYARQSRWRLDAEMVRDNALAVSDLLVANIGGQSAFPYQPAGYWGQLNFPKRTYQHDAGEAQYRRGLYTHWQRTFLHPSLLAFDAPSREECTARRAASNTPLQALVLLNDPTYVEAARVLAARIVREGGSEFSERLAWAYREALARKASPREAQLLHSLYERTLAVYQADAKAADRLLGTGEYQVPEDLDRVEAAAWTAVARAILNLHESITRY